MTEDVHGHILELLDPITRFKTDCHVASLMIASSASKVGLPNAPRTRVARGTCEGAGGQHSWVVVGDPYNPEWIIDPTIWHYRRYEPEPIIVRGDSSVVGQWVPHGSGNIWDWGRPPRAVGGVEHGYVLTPPKGGWSDGARQFLDLIGPLDVKGWAVLAHAPVQGWPSKEIIKQMYKDPVIGPHVPIDIVGMMTDENPKGLYW